MRNPLKIFAALSVIFLLSACSSPPKYLDYTGEKKLILEINWLSSMVIKYDLKIFNDGEVEYNGLKVVKSHLDNARLDRLKTMLVKLDGQSQHSTYSPTKTPNTQKPTVEGPPRVEVSVDYLSASGTKNIIIKENDWDIDLTLRRQYPSALIDLLKFTDELVLEKRKEAQQ